MEEKKYCTLFKTGTKIKLYIILALLLVVIVTATVISLRLGSGKDKGMEVITETALQKIIDVSEISTFEAVYNGVAVRTEEEKPDEILYYVSYEASVKAGFDLEKLQIVNDEDTKTIKVTLPPVEITDILVDEKTLDFIFENDSVNQSGISAEAYQICIEDVSNESQQETAIYDLAKENAVNTVKALLQPFVKQIDPEYAIEVL